jgi:pimeloyl-ACP methyl ester carboxylesterase
MTTFVLVPGAGGDAHYWHLVVDRLTAAGDEAIAVELPAEDDSAGLVEYADAIFAAIGDQTGVVLVAQSMGAMSAPLAAERADVAALLLVAPMIPEPGGSLGTWWSDSGAAAAAQAADRAAGRDPDAPFDPRAVFFHDVPDEVTEAFYARDEPEQSDAPFASPWPLERWPDVPTRVLAGRHDRLFPYDFMCALSRERLGIEPDTIDSGHLPALARPDELTAWIRASAAGISTAGTRGSSSR